jgi:hypothetical protein
MARESVLSMADKEAIKIEKLIFHIILTESVQPIFLEELVITNEQQKFFKDRLADAAQGRQFIFTSDNPPINKLAKKILNASDEDFLEISKEITNNFRIAHTGKNTNDGVFIISIASIKKRKLLFLIKLDHKKVYEYKLKGGKALLEEVKNTFSEDKTAIQKVALIDIDSNMVWDVLVFDRSKPGGITEFFARFLSVLPRETESDLTKKTQSAALKWASENKQLIDPDQEPSFYKNRARNYLMNANMFETEDYVNSVIQDDNDRRREVLKESFLSHLVVLGIAGQNFEPKREVLTPKDQTKNIRQTAEGVKIEWSGEMADKNILIPNYPNKNGEYIITIKTSDISEIQ